MKPNKAAHKRLPRRTAQTLALAALSAGIAVLCGSTTPTATAGTNPTLLISQIPLTIAAPAHPQVLIAIGNSQSMDGDLGGAIMTGSGALSSGLSSLTNSSSPVNYTVPAGFTPPVQAANSSGQAPYTVNQSGTLVDNGASRLNVAKQGVQAILSSYMQNTDFALEDYSTSGTSLYTTWVYYMSPQGSNFAFANSSTEISGDRYVTNPCYNYTSASSSVNSYCSSISGLYGASTLSSNPYMQIGASSDDPSINDVLYAGSGLPGLFDTYNGPNPASPYPPNFSLSNYNNGSIYVSYKSSSPSIGSFGTSPTNAGYVPYSPQVMYAERGFGYYVQSVSATSGNIVVPMTTAGSTPTTSSVSTAISQFAPYLKPETNSTSSKEIKALAYQSPLAGLLSKAKSYMTGLTPSSSSCPQKQYVVLISDGLPTMDLNGKAWPPLGSAAAQGYGVTATFNTNGSLNTTNDQALTDTISSLAALKAAGINTYIVGLGAGVDPTLNAQAAATLKAMAIAGGTGNYYPATSPTALVSDLNDILISVQNGSLATSSAAVNSTQLNTGTTGYQASFTSNDTPYQDWTGNLVATGLTPAANGTFTYTQKWSAQSLLDAQVSGTGWSTNRIIATWNPTLNLNAGGGAPFEWANISPTQQIDLQPSDALGQSRLQYLRGNTSLEQRNGGSFRNRSHVLGDIVDSQPLYVGIPSDPYFQNSYFAFQTTEANRTPVVYVGADDGMLHAFNANTGAEMFAYVPNAVFGNLANLTAPLYNQSHQFFVDGSPNAGDVQFSDGSWHTLLVGGENAGGNSIYALDVTNPQNITTENTLASSVKWEFSDSDMGLSYSQPQIAPISTPVASGSTATQSYAVFFGNGYNSPNNNAVLYALNPQTGAVISKINLCAAVAGACNANAPEGLSTVAVANADGLLGQPITQVYAGDLQGNLWAIDVSNPNPAQWTVRLLFQARDVNGNPQPITTPPVVTLNPNYPRKPGLFIMFGTGQLLTQADLNSQQTQSVYGVWDEPGGTTPFTRANLQQQTLTLVPTTVSGLPQDVLTDTNNAVNWGTQAGWYDDFPTPGERVVVNPDLFNGSFLATLDTPPSNLCSAGYTAMLLDINYQSGGAFTTPQLDVNGSGKITPSNNYNGSNPVGIALKPGFASQGVILTPTPAGSDQGDSPIQPGMALVMYTDPYTGKQYWKEVPLNQVPRSAWWQIQ